jgi:PAB-dependent poly(A)-specific ribonuclease subunit 3
MQPATLHHTIQPNWTPQGFQEFVPQTYDAGQVPQQSDAQVNMIGYQDPFPLGNAVTGMANTHQPASINPYAHDPTALAGATYFQNAATFAQPVR